MTEPKAIVIARGYARNAADEKRLVAAGIRVTYRADKKETLSEFKMRPGELLGVVGGLRAFGDGRRDMVAAVKTVHAWGAAIVDVDTGLRSDRDGAEMLHIAVSPRNLSPEYAAQMQAKSVKARIKDRMPQREALTIWRNPKLSTAEAADLMTGWSQAAAYIKLGPRFAPAGRKHSK